MKYCFRILIALCFLFGVVSVSGMDNELAWKAETPYKMLYIPGGSSTLGSVENDLYAKNDTKPLVKLDLKSFYMDQFEVTNHDYKRCVDAGVCAPPASPDSETRKSYFDQAAFEWFPVVNVTWDSAAQYCKFAKKRLPTEAEWEKAAMGTESYRRYPWGNFEPTEINLNIDGIPNDTEMVNSHAKGISPYGVNDAVGNVSEWVEDWYDADAYRRAVLGAAPSEASGTLRVTRGDSFKTPLSEIHLTNRHPLAPDQYNAWTGFRCAKDVREIITYTYQEPTVAPGVKQAIINSGQKEGVFVLTEPSIKKELVCVAPRGVVAKILEGPVENNFISWYKIEISPQCKGWTLATSLKF